MPFNPAFNKVYHLILFSLDFINFSKIRRAKNEMHPADVLAAGS